jgi:hypothetical protein
VERGDSLMGRSVEVLATWLGNGGEATTSRPRPQAVGNRRGGSMRRRRLPAAGARNRGEAGWPLPNRRAALEQRRR